MKACALASVLMASWSFPACGGGRTTPPPPATYTVGGMVTGLSGTGLVLQNNGGNNLPVSANGPFTFTTAVTSGDNYNVTVLTQPSTPAQTCAVTGGSGMASANVVNVQVACTTNSATNEWTWMGGSVFPSQVGVYGTLGKPSADNTPGAREWEVSWTDTTGNLWLFGGFGLDTNVGDPDLLNDLWKYSAGQWTWMGGSNGFRQAGIYGTQGTPTSSNVPGARYFATSSTDAAGNFWLFGGTGLDSTGPSGGDLNDLWKYSAGEWTWISGSNAANQPGTYGTLGMPAPSNVPAARSGTVSWIDAAGNFWLFGGSACCGSLTSTSYFNDLWKYSAGTGQWTWMSGSNLTDQAGTYGAQGTPSPGNIPGARQYAARWTDAAGNFWLFGGYGYDSSGTLGFLNDLWKYSAGTGQWTWMSGSNVANQPSTYGTQGVAAAGNVPGARQYSISLIDAAGNFWLFGGQEQFGLIGDLWKYSAGTGQWTWISGSNIANRPPTYGTQGVAAPGNSPGSRSSGIGWTDEAGNLWFFGGFGSGFGGYDILNDLWMYQP